MRNYSDLLKDPRWQKKRLEIFKRDNWSCKKCNDCKNTLHIHHLEYFKGRKPWEYDNKYLETLCYKCHENIHVILFEDIPERKYQHLINREQKETFITATQKHLDILMESLKNCTDTSIQQEIQKNIIYIQKLRKEHLNGRW